MGIGNKKNIEKLDKEFKNSTANEMEKVREMLKRAREVEHLYRIQGNELETTQKQLEVKAI